MKRKLPLQVDAVTTLVDVEYQPTNTIYWYTLDGTAEEFDRQMLEELTRKNACANAELLRTIRKKGFSYEYHYATKDNVAFAHFKVIACP